MFFWSLSMDPLLSLFQDSSHSLQRSFTKMGEKCPFLYQIIKGVGSCPFNLRFSIVSRLERNFLRERVSIKFGARFMWNKIYYRHLMDKPPVILPELNFLASLKFYWQSFSISFFQNLFSFNFFYIQKYCSSFTNEYFLTFFKPLRPKKET